ELAHELRRNYLEEGGERGKVPAHYILYTNALLADLGLLVNGHVPAAETTTLVLLHQVLVNSHMPSVIAGGYYATEGVAIAETEILRDITNRYGQLTSGTSGKDLPALDYYYRLHLDDDHEAAQGGGGLCGKIRFVVTAEPVHPRVCSGTHGQKRAGGPMQSWVSFPLGGLRWTAEDAEPTWYDTFPDETKRGCCSTCSSHVAAFD